MFDTVVTVLFSVGISTALSAALVWLLRSWIGERLKNAIKHEYDAKLESHKAQLKAALDLEIETHKARLQADNAALVEQLKADLQIAAFEHQVRFSRLHEDVARTVSETYSRLYNWAVAVERYVSVFERASGPSKKERRTAVADAMKDFADYFRPRKLYLPKQLANRIKAFEEKLFGLATEFMIGVEQGGDDRYPDRDTWAKVDKAMHEEARPLFEALEDEFRRLLGVRSDE